ncbi:MAG: DUF3047 domain-containing protein [Xanthomonadales bacterium]|nr:DUF3047 domain-containing protein [Xanthomonadales bacterium]
MIEQEGRRLLMVYAAEAEGRLEHPLDVGGSPGLRLSWRWRVDEHPRGAELGSDERDDHALRLCARIEPDPERPGERAARGLAVLLGGVGQSLCYHWDPELPAGQLAWSADGNTRIVVLRGSETAPGSWQVETRDLFEDFRTQFGGEPQRLRMLWVSARTAGTRARSLGYLADLRIEPGG